MDSDQILLGEGPFFRWGVERGKLKKHKGGVRDSGSLCRNRKQAPAAN